MYMFSTRHSSDRVFTEESARGDRDEEEAEYDDDDAVAVAAGKRRR